MFVDVATDDRTGWILALDNIDSSVPGDIDGEAYCAGAGQAVAAGTRTRSRARAERKLNRMIAEREASH